MEWCLGGLICSSWINIKIGRFLGQNHLYCRFLAPTILAVLMFFLMYLNFISYIDVDEEFFLLCILILLVLFWIIDMMMNFILRLKYVEHSKINEPVLKSFLLMIFCRPCAYGEMGNYIKIQNERNSEPC